MLIFKLGVVKVVGQWLNKVGDNLIIAMGKLKVENSHGQQAEILTVVGYGHGQTTQEQRIVTCKEVDLGG